jgi:hypothetical protein
LFAKPHKANQLNYAQHGVGPLGGLKAFANRIGWEFIGSFHKDLAQCNLDLNLDVNQILQMISFKDEDGISISLKPLPYHPFEDSKKIAIWCGYY